MDNNQESLEITKQQILSKERKKVILLMILSVLSILSFFLFPPLGILLFLLWIILDIVYLVNIHKIKKAHPEIWKTQERRIAPSAPVPTPVENYTQDDQSQGVDHGQMTFAQKAVASYALGKAATTIMDKKTDTSSRNPNADRYAKAQQDAMSHRRLNSQSTPERIKVRFKNGGNGYIEIESNGYQYLVDSGKRRIGSYDPMKNVTYDKNGKTIGKGNLLEKLL